MTVDKLREEIQSDDLNKYPRLTISGKSAEARLIESCALGSPLGYEYVVKREGMFLVARLETGH